MKTRRRGIDWGLLRGFWLAHADIWRKRAEYLRTQPAFWIGAEMGYVLFFAVQGVIVDAAGVHPALADNLLAFRADALLHMTPPSHFLLGTALIVSCVCTFVALMEQPSPGADGKAPSGWPPRKLAFLLGLRIAGSVVTTIFCSWGMTLTIFSQSHANIPYIMLGGAVCGFVFCWRAGAQYARDVFAAVQKKPARRAAPGLPVTP